MTPTGRIAGKWDRGKLSNLTKNLVQMDGRIAIEKDNEMTMHAKIYKGWEVVESHVLFVILK